MTIVHHKRLGLLTDIHYDGGTQAMNRLYESVVALNAGGADVLVVMGDLVNGNSGMHTKRLLREVSAICNTFKGRIYYMAGNHDLDYLTKAEFYNVLEQSGSSSWFDFTLGEHLFICIDGNFSPDGTEYKRGNFNWRESAVSAEQIEWLRARLGEVALPVVIISHQRLDKECIYAVRNHEAVRKVLSESGKVVAAFQGHNHQDDLLQIDGTLFYTLNAIVGDAGPAIAHLGSEVLLSRDVLALN